jgi:hypothetical protein
MTIRYTHIGIGDQAKALRQLPCQHIVSNSAVFGCQQTAAADRNAKPENEETPVTARGSVVACHPLAKDDRMEAAGIEPATWIESTEPNCRRRALAFRGHERGSL